MKQIVLAILNFIILAIILSIIILYYMFTYDTSPYIKKLRLIRERKSISKKILIVTLETRKSKMLDIHNNNISNYCKNNDYNYMFLDKYENEIDMPIYWKKIQLVNDLLNNKNYDYIMWMDSDTLVLEPDIKIDNILGDKSIYIGKDYGKNIYCAGVFIIKNDNIGNIFIKECINTYINNDKCKDKNGNYSLNSDWAGDCYEQGIMNKLLKTKYKEYTYILEPYIIWNLDLPVSNIFILHLFGGSNKRADVFKKLVKNNKAYDSRINQLLYYTNYLINFIL